MQKIFSFILIFSWGCFLTSAQSVFGKWKTFDIYDKDKEEAIVEIFEENDSLHIKIIEIIPEEHKEDICIKCDDDNRNQPILDLIILEGAILKDGIWQGAKILNAKNGYRYGCNISLISENLLKIRGFIGIPFFGKTVFWEKIDD
jgi:uncharacterized protein (DUF2147 family)